MREGESPQVRVSRGPTAYLKNKKGLQNDGGCFFSGALLLNTSMSFLGGVQNW